MVLGVLKGGDGGIFVVSERFDVCFGRFRGIGGVWKVVFGRDGIILNDVLGALGGLGGVLEVMGCFGGFGGALIGVGGGFGRW